MSTFQVPQFIEEKPKIIGPLTLAQFFYVASAAGIIFASFYVFNFFFWITFSIIVGGVGVALAFVKINGQALPSIAIAALGYLWKPRTYTWQRELAKKETAEVEKIEAIRKNISLGEKMKSIALGVLTRKTPSIRLGGETESQKYQVVTFMSGEKRMAKKVDY